MNAFWVLVVVGGQAIGSPLLGWLAEQVGPKNALVLAGAVVALAAVALGLILARSGRLKVAVTSRRGRWVAIVPRSRGTST